jgi:hypothetical protein
MDVQSSVLTKDCIVHIVTFGIGSKIKGGIESLLEIA